MLKKLCQTAWLCHLTKNSFVEPLTKLPKKSRQIAICMMMWRILRWSKQITQKFCQTAWWWVLMENSYVEINCPKNPSNCMIIWSDGKFFCYPQQKLLRWQFFSFSVRRLRDFLFIFALKESESGGKGRNKKFWFFK